VCFTKAVREIRPPVGPQQQQQQHNQQQPQQQQQHNNSNSMPLWNKQRGGAIRDGGEDFKR